MRILLPSLASKEWMGGVNYLINLVSAIRFISPESKFVHMGKITDQNLLFDLFDTEFDFVPYKRFSLNWFYDCVLIDRFKFPLKRRINEIRNIADVVMFITEEKVRSKIPSLFWVPDFQHIHMPGFFSENEILQRNLLYKDVFAHCTIIITSSEDAKKDIGILFPEYLSKVRVLKFVPSFSKELFLLDSSYIFQKYNLPKKFIYVPNQFWKHKNHKIIFEAIQILKNKNIFPYFVFTGNTNDYRHPNYFAELNEYIQTLGIESQYQILGLVSNEDRVSLMKECFCMINPSFFEGWATSVEESKCFSKSILLSSIAVHREQIPTGKFFSPDSPKELANCIESEWASEKAIPNWEKVFLQNQEKVEEFGMRAYSILEEAIQIYHYKG